MSLAEKMRKAIEGCGTDEAALIDIAANHTSKERQAIASDYKTKYGRDLVKDLKSDLNGKLEDAMVALFTEPIEYDADELRAAMKGLGTNEDTLIEIIFSRDSATLKKIKDKYKEKYNRDLEKDVASETSGTLKKILISVLQCRRSTATKMSDADATKAAQDLYEAGEKKKGTDEETFVKYFGSLSTMELVLVAQKYHKLYGHTILDAINSETSGDTKKALTTIVYSQISPSEYFAKRVKESIKGFGTNDHLLMRVLITRDEIDMPDIKKYYKQLYGKDMVEDVKNDISGDYRKLMVELCSH